VTALLLPFWLRLYDLPLLAVLLSAEEYAGPSTSVISLSNAVPLGLARDVKGDGDRPGPGKDDAWGEAWVWLELSESLLADSGGGESERCREPGGD
jgi:hypothetical protein